MMLRILLGAAVLIAIVWAASCAVMVLVGLRVLRGGFSSTSRNQGTPSLSEGLAPQTGAVLICSGMVLGVPLAVFACWGLACLASGGP
jgi:hypothetical protein